VLIVVFGRRALRLNITQVPIEGVSPSRLAEDARQ
jgi:hypothetical protein